MKKLNISISILCFLVISFGCREKGCMDPFAYNYDSEAKKNDGSCIDPNEFVAGTYSMTEISKSDGCNDGWSFEEMNVRVGSSYDDVYIDNFLGAFDNVQCIIDNNSITYSVNASQDLISKVDGKVWTMIGITGIINDRTISMDVLISDVDHDNTCGKQWYSISGSKETP